MAGALETLAVDRRLAGRHGAPPRGGACRGYGWPATLELLSPPIGKPVDSRQTIKMNICPLCRLVHEAGGSCISRHVNLLPSVAFAPATAIGNENPLELHSRTIQQLIAANLTLAAAWTWIEQLMRNESGNVTSFPLVVTGEIYTLGFDSMVLNVLANMTVENSGNSSMPQPAIRDQGFWGNIWNSFTGMLEAAWNAVVAVATFIANVALAVIRWCIDFAIAIAEGRGLEFFYETVVKPFVDALMAFIRFIVNLIVAAAQIIFNAVVQPVLGMVRGWGLNILAVIQNAYERLASGQSTSDVGERLGWAIIAAFAPFFVLGVLLAVVCWLLAPFMFILGLVVAALSAAWMISMLASLGTSAPQNPGYQSPLPPWDAAAIFAAALDFMPIADDSTEFPGTRSERGPGTRGDSEEEDWQVAVFSLIFAGAALLLDIVAGYMIEPSVAAIVLGIGSFLIVFFTVGAIAVWHQDIASALLLLDLVLSLYGLVVGFIASIKPGPAQGFGISGFLLSVVSFTVALAGETK